MKAIPRKGSWRQVAPGQYVKNIGSYGDVKFGATTRVNFVPFPTCEIMDGNGVHVAIPTPADQKKFIAAAKKVYVKDTKAEATRLQKREVARTAPTKRAPPKATPGMVQCGADNMARLTKAQQIEAEIKTLRGRLTALGRAPPKTSDAYRPYKAEKSRIVNAIKTRQAGMRKLLPAKYRTPKQFATALKKTYEAEASVYRKPQSSAAESGRDATLSAIAAAYRGN